jgi:hypothetical protein
MPGPPPASDRRPGRTRSEAVERLAVIDTDAVIIDAGIDSGHRRWLRGDDHPPPEMAGMYYLG